MPHTGEDLATALPSMSALAPAVTGLPPAAGDVPDHTEPDPYEAADPYAEPYGEAPETNEPEEPAADADFGQVLTEVLQEQHAGPAAAEAGAPDPQDEDASALAPATQTGGQETEEPSRPAPRVTAVTSSVLAALTTPPDPPAAPQIRVLGPVDVVGTLGKVESYRVNALTEIAAWMVLHPGGTRHELDEAIWPGQRILANARNSMISKLRTWLGRDPRLPADDPQGAYLPPSPAACTPSTTKSPATGRSSRSSTSTACTTPAPTPTSPSPRRWPSSAAGRSPTSTSPSTSGPSRTSRR